MPKFGFQNSVSQAECKDHINRDEVLQQVVWKGRGISGDHELT